LGPGVGGLSQTSQPTNHLTKQLSQPNNNKPAKQPNNHPNEQLPKASNCQRTNQTTNHPQTNEPTGQPADQPTNQRDNLTSQPNHRAGLEARGARGPRARLSRRRRQLPNYLEYIVICMQHLFKACLLIRHVLCFSFRCAEMSST